MIGVNVPPQVTFVYAHKLYLFICYWIAFLTAENHIYIGTILMLMLLIGHLDFLTHL